MKGVTLLGQYLYTPCNSFGNQIKSQGIENLRFCYIITMCFPTPYPLTSF